MGKKVTREVSPDIDASLPAEKDPVGLNIVKFEVFGEEMLEKEVKPSGNSGRVYLPPDWVGSRVKVIRIR
jgi:putative transposon-encoded protein